MVVCCFTLLPFAFADFPVQKGANQETTPVVAYNSTNHEYLTVWTEEILLGATTVSSLKGRRLAENGEKLGDAFTISTFTSYPTIAYNPHVNEFVVVGNSYGNMVGQRVSGSGTLLGRQTTLMSGTFKARIVCNSITGEYLIVGAQTSSTPGVDQLLYSSRISADLQRVSTPQLVLTRTMGDAACERALTAIEQEVDIALAFAPIEATQTPEGRYLLVVSPGVDVRMLDSRGAIIQVLHDDRLGRQYPQLPFSTGNPSGGEFNVDVAYGWGQIEDIPCPAFLIVWSDKNNEWYGSSWSGIWGGYVDATRLVYDAHDLVPDRAFPISNICAPGTVDSLVAQWLPKVSYNPSSQTFFTVWRETPTDLYWYPTAKTNIRCNRIKGADPWISLILSDTVSVGNPKYSTVAASTTSEYALVVWQDSRDSVLTKADIFGSIEKVGASVAVPSGGIVVTNTDDVGTGSLRQAILSANARVGRDSIKFNIPGTGPHTIRPSSPLPVITDTLVIDGYSQPGSTVNIHAISGGTNAVLKIELDGSAAGTDAVGLVCASPWCVVRGLVVNRFTNAGIALIGDYNSVLGCFLGTDVSGRTRMGNGSGVTVSGPTVRSFVGGAGLREYRNLISGNATAGVIVNCGNGHVYVAGNLIGSDATGKLPLGNTQVGIAYLSGGLLYMGGFTVEGANVISGCGNNGQDGQTPVRGAGIFITEQGQNAVLAGNIVGLNAAGDAPIENFMDGILARSPLGVWPDEDCLPNVISGNAFTGIRIEKRGSSDTALSRIIGAHIGTDIKGETAIGNQTGITISDGARARIDSGNVIAFSLADGVAVFDSATAGIGGNSIYGNGRLGINLVGGEEDASGRTANDRWDKDTGPNGLLNNPHLVSAIGGDNIKISFSLQNEPNTIVRTDFYCSPPGGNPESGEGKELLGMSWNETDTSGSVGPLVVAMGRPLPAGWVITATANLEKPYPVTSEFSSPLVVTVATEITENEPLPQESELMQNYPNPFNPTTTIRFTIAGVVALSGSEGPATKVRLVVHDLLGREVAVLVDEQKEPGYYTVPWNAGRFASGVYYARLQAGEEVMIRKMLLVR
jgi:hypothetical protein